MPNDIEAEIAGLLKQAGELGKKGQLAEGMEIARRAADRARSALGGEAPALADALALSGTILEYAGDLAGAEAPFTEALAIRRKRLAADAVELAVSFEDLAVLHYRMGDYAGAAPFYREALSVYRRRAPEGDESVARVLNNLAMMYGAAGSFAESKPLLVEAIAIRKRVLGEEDFQTTASLLNLASAERQLAEHAAAEAHIQEALAIRRRTLGEDDPEVAHGLNDLADLYAEQGRYAEAAALFQRVVDIEREAKGEDHADVAMALSNLASVWLDTGDYATAAPLLRRAVAILRALGVDRDTGLVLHQLGVLHDVMGNYKQAEAYFRESLAIARRLLGADHPEVAVTLDMLASVRQGMGDYGGAERLYQEALAIRRARLGEEHPDLALTLSNLASLYQAMGDAAAAEPLYEEALSIQRKCYGEEHREVAFNLDNLGVLYLARGDLDAAERAFSQALAIRRKLFGAEHDLVARSLQNLAELRAVTGDRAAARPLFEEALALQRRALGDDHPEVIMDLQGLATFEAVGGDYAAAEAHFQEALTRAARTLGEDHPLHVTVLHGLAALHVCAGRDADARATLDRLLPLEDRLIERVFAVGSEQRRGAYLATIGDTLHVLLTLVRRTIASSPEAARTALDYVLRRKAIETDALSVQRDLVLGGRYPALAAELAEIAALRAQIARKALDGPGPEGLEAQRKTIGEWRERAQRLEVDLARQIPEMSLDATLRGATRAAVAAALPAGSVLIEIVRYREWSPPSEGNGYPPRYLALVLRAGEPDGVVAVDLGGAEEIDDLVTRFRASIHAVGSDGRYLVPLAREEAGPPAGAQLRAAVFAPIEAVIGDHRRLFIAPDGELSRIPFEVLPSADGRLLVDDYAVSYLGVGRDLLRFGVRSAVPAAAPIVIADPAFSLGQPATSPAEGAQVPPTRARLRGAVRFERLPATRAEGVEIAARLGVSPWLGEDALEGRLDEQRSPRVLHIATHGFFLARSDRAAPPAFGDALDRVREAGRDNPLLCSGLALAGASTWLDGGALPPEAEDGILNGEDVSALDLCATELAVLSACETGLGEIRLGDGVHGLRRAFIVAGAKTLVMSLWKVPDAETRKLMVAFYDGVLAGLPRAEALRAAQLAVRAERPEPFFWGAFICQGEPGPLPVEPAHRGEGASPR
ncbi:MAG: CHAT domain-containing protein [Minicystis sp.]